MAAAARALINVPQKARRGEVIGIKALISHVMETGFRPNSTGQLIPRDIIKEFVCTYNGTEVFRAEFFPAVSANPFVAFTTRATESGTITMTWSGDNGFHTSESVAIVVE
jgi:sulfur-oxidizing protein SoxZ